MLQQQDRNCGCGDLTEMALAATPPPRYASSNTSVLRGMSTLASHDQQTPVAETSTSGAAWLAQQQQFMRQQREDEEIERQERLTERQAFFGKGGMFAVAEKPPQQQMQTTAQQLLAADELLRCETLNLFRAQLQQLSRHKDGLMPKADGSFPEDWLLLAWEYQGLAEEVITCQRWPGTYPEGLLTCVAQQVVYLKRRLETFPSMSDTEKDQFRRLYVLAALGIIAKLKLVTFCWTFVELKRGEELARKNSSGSGAGAVAVAQEQNRQLLSSSHCNTHRQHPLLAENALAGSSNLLYSLLRKSGGVNKNCTPAGEDALSIRGVPAQQQQHEQQYVQTDKGRQHLMFGRAFATGFTGAAIEALTCGGANTAFRDAEKKNGTFVFGERAAAAALYAQEVSSTSCNGVQNAVLVEDKSDSKRHQQQENRQQHQQGGDALGDSAEREEALEKTEYTTRAGRKTHRVKPDTS